MSKELKIGVFAVTILIVSYFLINYLRGEDIFNNEIELSSRYENVEGLLPSAPVYIKGYKAGKVSEVLYVPETGDFKVTCSIDKDFMIPTDSRMTIYSVDIMGGRGVRIDLGHSDESAEDGGILEPAFEAGLMDGLAGGVGPLIEKVSSTLDSLSVTIGGVNRLLSDGNQASITRTLAHLEKTMSSLGHLAGSFEGKSDELEAVIDNMAVLSERLNSISVKADSTIDGVDAIVTTLSESDLAGVVSSLNSLLESMNDPEGTIGKLFVDDSVYDSVDSLLNDVDILIHKIQENPKKYLRISVF
ncbi:MAG: MCE family protein [Bacteroidales bacterium]|nr:MCE family protein [Bacteroidales bacterium]